MYNTHKNGWQLVCHEELFPFMAFLKVLGVLPSDHLLFHNLLGNQDAMSINFPLSTLSRQQIYLAVLIPSVRNMCQVVVGYIIPATSNDPFSDPL